ncbi:MAG: hypothetical protein ACFFE5_15790 [Candidatus Thorarchaeota archaeon]
MKLKEIKVKISPENRNFLISFIITALITFFLTYIPVWQLIIIPGIVGGLLNKTMRRGIYSGVLGVSIVWLFYMIYKMSTNNAYTNLDQFAGLIFGGLGYGIIIFILILLLGILFGALGGAIGSGIIILLTPYLQKRSIKNSGSTNTSDSRGNIKK